MAAERPAEQRTLFDPGLAGEVRRIELRSRRAITADLMGQYRSSFRGTGLLFADTREYQPGDDIRHIHWKVSARTDKVYVKSYEEERHLHLIAAVDISSSTNFGAPRTRHVRALEFTALIAMLAHGSHDSVGLALFSDRLDAFHTPRHHRSQIHRMMFELMRERELRPATDLAPVLRSLTEQLRRPAIIFIVSDFLSPDFEAELTRCAIRHDVILVYVDDPLEAALPDLGLIEFHDAETGERLMVDSTSPSVRHRLERSHADREQALRGVVERAGADLIIIRDNPLQPLAELMRRRARRLR